MVEAETQRQIEKPREHHMPGSILESNLSPSI